MIFNPRQRVTDVLRALKENGPLVGSRVLIRVDYSDPEISPTSELIIGGNVIGTFTIDDKHYITEFEPKGHLSYATVRPYLDFFEKLYG